MMRPASKLDAFACVVASIFLFVLPFAHVTALRQVALVLSAAAAVWAWRAFPGPKLPLKLPLALWLGMAVVSIAWARDPAYSLGEIRSEIVYDGVCFLIFFALTRDRWHWNVFRGALLSSLLVLTVGGLWYYVHNRNLDARSHLGGVLSISSYLVTVFPLLLVGAFEFRKDPRLLAILALAAVAALLVGYLTFNRMFILSINLCAIVVVLTLARDRVGILQRPGRMAAAVVLVLVASAAFFYSVAQERARTDFGGETTVHATVQGDPRWEIWRFSLGLIREHPLTGTGFGLFSALDLYEAELHGGAGNVKTHAHNPFLNYAVQMGIGGVAVLLFLLFSLFREFWRLWRSGDPRVGLLGATGLTMLVTVVFKAQPDDLWGRHNGYLFWSIIGMILGYAHRLLAASGAPAGQRADPP